MKTGLTQLVFALRAPDDRGRDPALPVHVFVSSDEKALVLHELGQEAGLAAGGELEDLIAGVGVQGEGREGARGARTVEAAEAVLRQVAGAGLGDGEAGPGPPGNGLGDEAAVRQVGDEALGVRGSESVGPDGAPDRGLQLGLEGSGPPTTGAKR
jgi:hypothetical protein